MEATKLLLLLLLLLLLIELLFISKDDYVYAYTGCTVDAMVGVYFCLLFSVSLDISYLDPIGWWD